MTRLCRRALAAAKPHRASDFAALREQKSEVNFPHHLVEEKRTEEGLLIHHRLMTDDHYLHSLGVNVPSPERRSAYYSVVREGVRHHVFNADRKPYGEVVHRAAAYLTGKHKPTFVRNEPCAGDVVVIVNADKVLMRGEKLREHKVRYHTGSPGGLKTRYTKHLIFQKPEALFIQAVYKVLPKTKLRETYLRNLHVSRGPLPRDMPWLPGFAPAPHVDRNALAGLPLDPRKHVIVHNAAGEVPPELAGFRQELMSAEELFGGDDRRSLPAHLQHEVRRYNAWVKRRRQQLKDWRARPPRTDRNLPFRDSNLYYYHSDKQLEKYPFLREFLEDNREVGEEGERD